MNHRSSHLIVLFTRMDAFGRVLPVTCGSGPLLCMAGYLSHWVQINFISIIVSDILLVTIKCLLIWNIVDANDLLVICASWQILANFLGMLVQNIGHDCSNIT